jgi:hypothetical protein
MYGHLSDQEVYEAMLDQDVDLFVRLTVELAESLCLDDVDYVVGDSAEGYNPTHDFCRTIIGEPSSSRPACGGRWATTST